MQMNKLEQYLFNVCVFKKFPKHKLTVKNFTILHMMSFTNDYVIVVYENCI